MNTKTIRAVQLFVISCVALYATFVCLGNLMDYNSNYEFVKHVFAMDTTFPGNDLMWRAITNDTLVNLAYWGIIVAEGGVAVLGWIAATKMCRNFSKSAEEFNKSKTIGFYAFLLAIAIWFIGFICVGSEWFAMWQSETWNGKQTAMDIVEVLGIFLVIYMLPAHAFMHKKPATHIQG
jgi:predicted small integral membrane protein